MEKDLQIFDTKHWMQEHEIAAKNFFSETSLK